MPVNTDADYQYALALQNHLNNQTDTDYDNDDNDVQLIESKLPSIAESKYHVRYLNDDLNRTRNLVHPDWETLDPTPDVHVLFKQFNTKFFQSRLICVQLEWSKRMYSCAGICYQRRNRYGMEVTIRLSEPLLKLRPRKDLVETMLHEMIHAYCFVLNIRESNGGHGPNFKKIMNAINKVAGTNITVYHTFHNEVNVYKQYWWRCNGVCQERSPFYGYVKRTNNRAPGPYDQWWAQHMRSCGGTFLKIKEPEKSKKDKKAKKTKEQEDGTNLLKFLTPATDTVVPVSKIPKTREDSSLNKNTPSIRKESTKLPDGSINATEKLLAASSISKTFPPTSYPGLSAAPLSNSRSGSLVIDLENNTKSAREDNVFVINRKTNDSATHNMPGRGYVLSPDGDKNSANVLRKCTDGAIDRDHLRDVWSKRFPCNNNNNNNNGSKNIDKNEKKEIENHFKELNVDVKRRRSSSSDSSCSSIKIGNSDVIIVPFKEEVIEISDSDSSNDGELLPIVQKKYSNNEERKQAIKQEILDESVDLQNEDIVLIDDEYDDSQDVLAAATELADTSLIDEIFGEDTLIKEFQQENDLVPCGSNYHKNPANDIITCPICFGKMKRSELLAHLDGCTGIAITVPSTTNILRKNKRRKAEQRTSTPLKAVSTRQVLRNAGYTDKDIADIDANNTGHNSNTLSSSSSNSEVEPAVSTMVTLRQQRCGNLYKTARQCPRCGVEFEPDDLKLHYYECPEVKRKKM